jgi:hypothetical protein
MAQQSSGKSVIRAQKIPAVIARAWGSSIHRPLGRVLKVDDVSKRLPRKPEICLATKSGHLSMSLTERSVSVAQSVGCA